MPTTRPTQSIQQALAWVQKDLLRTPFDVRLLAGAKTAQARGTAFEIWWAKGMVRGLQALGFSLGTSWDISTHAAERAVFKRCWKVKGSSQRKMQNRPELLRYDPKLIRKPTLLMQPFGGSQGAIDAALMIDGVILLVSIKGYKHGQVIKHNSSTIHPGVLYVYICEDAREGHIVFHGSLLGKNIQKSNLHGWLGAQANTGITKLLNHGQRQVIQDTRRCSRDIKAEDLLDYFADDCGLENRWDLIQVSMDLATQLCWSMVEDSSEREKIKAKAALGTLLLSEAAAEQVALDARAGVKRADAGAWMAAVDRKDLFRGGLRQHLERVS